jgi:hypothetical protein
MNRSIKSLSIALLFILLTSNLLFSMTDRRNLPFLHGSDNFLCMHKWQINGINAALKDQREDIQALALNKMAFSPCLKVFPSEYFESIANSLNIRSLTFQLEAIRLFGSMSNSAAFLKPQLISYLSNDNDQIRSYSCYALANIGNLSHGEYLSILPLLNDKNEIVRESVVYLISQNRNIPSELIPMLISFLDSDNKHVVKTALNAIAAIGPKAKVTVPNVVQFTNNQPPEIRKAALTALGNLGEPSLGYIEIISEKATIERSDVRAAAISSIGKLANHSQGLIPYLISKLDSCDANTCESVYKSLSEINYDKAEYINEILFYFSKGSFMQSITASFLLLDMEELSDSLLKDIFNLLIEIYNIKGLHFTIGGPASEFMNSAPLKFARYIENYSKPFISTCIDKLNSTERNEQIFASNVLSNIENLSIENIDKILSMLENRIVTTNRVKYCLLKNIDTLKSQYFDRFSNLLLTDHKKINKYDIIQILCSIGEPSKKYLPQMISIIKNAKNEYNAKAITEFYKVGAIQPIDVLAIINYTYQFPNEEQKYRFYAHLFGSGRETIETLLKFTGNPQTNLPKDIKYKEATKILSILYNIFEATKQYPKFYSDLCNKTVDFINKSKDNWKKKDIGLLKYFANNMENSTQTISINLTIDAINRGRYFNFILVFISSHFIFWFTLLLIYPRSHKIQAFFFWNNHIRKYLGLFYVHIIIIYIPYIQKILFRPFTKLLVADARLDEFEDDFYFEETKVKGKNLKDATKLVKQIDRISGLIVLEGASGAGKTTFIRHLMKKSKRIQIYLLAEKCKLGVLEAIRDKLQGITKDITFLRTLIYSGCLDIIIDGINESDIDTRGRISDFFEGNHKCNALLITQPIEWNTPFHASIYKIQPMQYKDIETFLKTRWALFNDGSTEEDGYIQSVDSWLSKYKEFYKEEKDSYSMANTLFNLMDLTTVAQLLVHKISFNLFNLQHQQFKLAMDDYKKKHADTSFPIEQFSSFVYRMKMDNRSYILDSGFDEELYTLEKYKMTLKRHRIIENGNSKTVWYFRHEKIMDYYIVHYFMKNSELRSKHLKDQRFRGVYCMLAFSLPMNEAKQLREEFIDYSIQYRDHSLSDDYIRYLKLRSSANM